MDFKNFTIWDIGATKLAVVCATLFLVSVWPAFADWVVKTHWAWFLVPALILAIKPLIVVFKK